MKRHILFIALLSIYLAVACQPREEQEQISLVTTTVKNVERVLMHEPGNYTFFYTNPKAPNELLPLRIPAVIKVNFFQDVPAEENSWLTFTSYGECLSICHAGLLELHLHSAQEINGTGWDHGKFGRGQTIVVE